RIKLPTSGLSRPPSLPGGGVISVNTRSDSPANPCHSNAPRISASQPSPIKVASTDSVIAMRLRRRRAAYNVFMVLFDLQLEPHQQIACDGKDDEGDDKQDQPEGDQRRGVDVAHRLGELVGNGRGDRGAGRQNRA